MHRRVEQTVKRQYEDALRELSRICRDSSARTEREALRLSHEWTAKCLKIDHDLQEIEELLKRAKEHDARPKLRFSLPIWIQLKNYKMDPSTSYCELKFKAASYKEIETCLTSLLKQITHTKSISMNEYN